jgi:hypothetical protein
MLVQSLEYRSTVHIRVMFAKTTVMNFAVSWLPLRIQSQSGYGLIADARPYERMRRLDVSD